MATLYTGSAEVDAGVEYANLTGAANAMQTTERTRISINRRPYAWFPAYVKIFVSPLYTYSFESNTVVLFSNEIEPDFYITSIAYNTNDIILANGTESAAIVTLTDKAGKEVTTGDIAAFVSLHNDANQTRDIVMRMYGNTIGLLGESSPLVMVKDTTANMTYGFELTKTIPAGEVLSFTLEADGNDVTVKGTTEPSQLRLVRKNL